MRITVIGTGYLSATHAVAMAGLGHEVLGVDVDPVKIEASSVGQVPFFEPGLSELLKKYVESGRLHFTTNYDEAVEFTNVHFVGVGTPQVKGSCATDARYMDAAITELAKCVVGKHLMFGKPTVPVGTAPCLQELTAKMIGERAAAGGEQLKNTSLEIAWNPEFLREGFAVKDTLEPDRVVLDTQKPGMILNDAGQEVESVAEASLRECFGSIFERETPLIITDTATAELVEVSANAFLATKISFINAVSEICEVTGADITTLANTIGMDARIGRYFLNAGPGFGGGYLPKDICAFMARVDELGVDQALTFPREVDAINMCHREKTVDLVHSSFGDSLLGHTVTMLGATFRPNSDDVRDSPALSIAGSLSLAGASVGVYDPQVMENAKKNFPTLDYAPSIEAALEGSEMVVVATEWQQPRDIDPVATKKLIKHAVMLSGRNYLPTDQWRIAGWDVTCLGRD